MREKLTVGFAIMAMIILIPYLLTVFIAGSGSAGDVQNINGKSLSDISMEKTISLEVDGLYKVLDVEAYIAGILPGIIDVTAEEEVLKAQAVIIRTNLLKEMEETGSNNEEDLPYAYLPLEELKEQWGEKKYEKNMQIMERAVITTAGKVVVCDGELIEAMYHQVSIGKTADSQEVLNQDISYLKSVDSVRDIEAKDYMQVLSFTKEELENKFKTELNSIQVTKSTENGYVKEVTIGTTIYDGEEIKKILGLNSINFYIEPIDTGYRLVCLGKGHCMGLSWHGAGMMAKEGKTYEEILKYYYTNVSVVDFD